MNNNNYIYIPHINILKELDYLKKEIILLKDKINELEKKKINNYLTKNDDYYIL